MRTSLLTLFTFLSLISLANAATKVFEVSHHEFYTGITGSEAESRARRKIWDEAEQICGKFGQLELIDEIEIMYTKVGVIAAAKFQCD